MITSDVQSLEPEELIELFEIDSSSLGAEVYRFHSHKYEGVITFQDLEYRNWAVGHPGLKST